MKKTWICQNKIDSILFHHTEVIKKTFFHWNSIKGIKQGVLHELGSVMIRRFCYSVPANQFSANPIMFCIFFTNWQAKQLCEVLEEQLVDLLVLALDRFERDTTAHGDSQLQWQHLSSQLIYFVLFQFASFSHIVHSLYKKVSYSHRIFPLNYLKLIANLKKRQTKKWWMGFAL